MKGRNELILNTATMMEAIQEWLDRRMPDGAPEVTNVASKDSTRGVFEVVINERAALNQESPK